MGWGAWQAAAVFTGIIAVILPVGMCLLWHFQQSMSKYKKKMKEEREKKENLIFPKKNRSIQRAGSGEDSDAIYDAADTPGVIRPCDTAPVSNDAQRTNAAVAASTAVAVDSTASGNDDAADGAQQQRKPTRTEITL